MNKQTKKNRNNPRKHNRKNKTYNSPFIRGIRQPETYDTVKSKSDTAIPQNNKKIIPVPSEQQNNKKNNKPARRKSALVDIHEKFIKDVGLGIYAYARRQGYSVFGAKFLLALAAQESGYGNSKALNKFLGLNNFFGINAGKRKFNTEEEGIGYLLEQDTGLIHRKYHLLDSLLKEDSPSLSLLDIGLKGYNLDSNGKNYATWLYRNVFKGVTKRTLADIPKRLAELQGEIDTDESHIGKDIPFLAKAAPFLLSDKAKLGLQAINEEKAEMKNLRDIQQELETGKAKKANSYQLIANSQLPPPFVSEIPGAPGVEPSSTEDLFEQPNQGENIYPLKDTAKMRNGLEQHYPHKLLKIPKAGNNSPSGSSKNGGKGGNTSFNIQGTSFHSNTVPIRSPISADDIYDAVIEILTSAVADSRIGTDIH